MRGAPRSRRPPLKPPRPSGRDAGVIIKTDDGITAGRGQKKLFCPDKLQSRRDAGVIIKTDDGIEVKAERRKFLCPDKPPEIPGKYISHAANDARHWVVLIEPIAELCASFLELHAHMETCQRCIHLERLTDAAKELEYAKTVHRRLGRALLGISETALRVSANLPPEAKMKGSAFLFLQNLEHCSQAIWGSLYLNFPPDEEKLNQFDLAIRLVRKVLEHLHQILSSFGRILIQYFRQESTDL